MVRLERPAEAETWAAQASALLARLLAHFWRADRFVAVAAAGHQDVAAESLLLYLPLLLGMRLPAEVRAVKSHSSSSLLGRLLALVW